MTTHLDVFVSSKMGELRPEREALYKLLPMLDYGDVKVRAWVFEDTAPASNHTIRSTYLKALEKSALYIGIFWNEFGDWTIDEFNNAVEWGIDRHIYVKNVVLEDKPRDPRLEAFLSKHGAVTQGGTAKWFKTIEELCDAVRSSINVWLQERVVKRPGATSAIYCDEPEDLVDRPDKLFGREELLQEIATLLILTPARVLLQGAGGMGKTSLAAEVAARWIDAGQGAVLWLRAGDSPVEKLFEALARPFNAQGDILREPGEAQAKVLRNLLKARNIKLLVLDDVWNPKALMQLLKGIPRELPVLVTARLRYPGLRFVDVSRLQRSDALALLSYHAQTDYAADVDADRLCDLLGDSAYALGVAGTMMGIHQRTPDDIFNSIQNAPHQLKMPREFADDNQESVADLLEVSLNELYLSEQGGKEAHNLFLAFGGLFAPTATLELLTLYTGRDQAAVMASLLMLSRRGLVELVRGTKESAPHYRMHNLAYSYARVQSNDDQRKRVLDGCVIYTDRYAECIPEHFAPLRAELDNLLNAAAWALTHEYYEAVEAFTRLYRGKSAAGGFMNYQGYYAESIVLARRALEAAEKRGDRQQQAIFLSNLGTFYSEASQFTPAVAYLERALVIDRETEDTYGEALDIGNLGIAYLWLGRYPEAVQAFKRGLELARELENPRLQGSNLNNLGTVYAMLLEHEESRECFEQALKLADEIDDAQLRSYALGGIGEMLIILEEYDKARPYVEQALAASREVGARHSEVMHLTNMADLSFSVGKNAEGWDYAQQAADIARQTGNKRALAGALSALGQGEWLQKHYPEAVDYYQQALTISLETGERDREANTLEQLGTIAAEQGDRTQAADYYEQARAVAANLNIPKRVAQLDKLLAKVRSEGQ